MLIHEISTGAKVTFDNVRSIYIYGNGEIKFSDNNWCFEEYHTSRSDRYESTYMGKVDEINLSKIPVRAIKVNLSRKDNYFVKQHGRYDFEKGIALYIHESEISVQDDGEKIAMQNENQTCYLHAYTLTFQHGFKINRPHLEKIICDGSWKLPENGRWGNFYGTTENPCFDTFQHDNESGVIKRWRTTETAYTLTTKAGPYSRIEYSDECLENQRIADAINDARCFTRSVSHYDIERLKKICDIKLKEGDNA